MSNRRNWSASADTNDPWVDEPLSMTDNTARQAGDTYYLMKDRLGSIINILDENERRASAPIASFSGERTGSGRTETELPFGQPTATYHSGQVDCMHRFTGRVYKDTILQVACKHGQLGLR